MRPIKAKIDRVVLSSAASLEVALDNLGTFRTEGDHALRNTNAGFFLAPYGRMRRMVNDETNTRLFLSYSPRYRRLAPLRAVVVPDDVAGLRRRELKEILRAFSPYRLRIVEMAIDFPRRAT